MVLVLLGTQDNSFVRLLEEIDKCIDNKIIKDKVLVQSGYTKYSSNNMEIIDFVPLVKFEQLLKNADLIITHGGVGSIINSIKLGKKVIAVPRLQKYAEHVNDHQIQIIESFDKQGFIKGVFDLATLPDVLKEIDYFVPNTYISNTENILKIVSEYIDKN